MSLLVVAEFIGAVFYNIQVAYLCLQVGLTIVYALLVASRLLAFREWMEGILWREHTCVYEIATSMVIKSAALYSVLGVLFNLVIISGCVSLVQACASAAQFRTDPRDRDRAGDDLRPGCEEIVYPCDVDGAPPSANLDCILER